MLKKVLFRLLCFLILVSVSDIVYGGKGGSHRSSGGSVHVKGYYRKDSTYVSPHYRSAPHRHSYSSSSVRNSTSSSAAYDTSDNTSSTSKSTNPDPSPSTSTSSDSNPPEVTQSSTPESEIVQSTTAITKTVDLPKKQATPVHVEKPIESIKPANLFFGSVLLAIIGFGGFAIWKSR